MNLAIRCQTCIDVGVADTVCFMIIHSDVFDKEDKFKFCPIDKSNAEWKEITE